MPLAASNRIGTEQAPANRSVTFYGSSFIADATGQVVTGLDRHDEGIALATFDLNEIARKRAAWGLFRDRRPELYGVLTTLDGTL